MLEAFCDGSIQINFFDIINDIFAEGGSNESERRESVHSFCLAERCDSHHTSLIESGKCYASSSLLYLEMHNVRIIIMTSSGGKTSCFFVL